jgi:outer membrane immunogenic protein
MKFLLRTGAVLLALSAAGTAAHAADMPKGPYYKAPPAVFDWTGWYAGVDAGYLASRMDFITSSPGFSQPDPDGFVGGAHIGYRWQLPSRMVLGIEADIWGSSANGEALYVGLANSSRVDINWGGSVRGIVGITMSPTLLYATGGVAFIDLDGCTTVAGFGTPCVAGTTVSDTRVGWTVGFGLAHAFTPRLIARVEYLYANFGDEAYVTPGILTGGQTNIDLQTHTVRGGLSWRFSTR